jgi:hypothetical protein
MGARNESNWLLIQARADEIAARARREYLEGVLGVEAPPAPVSPADAPVRIASRRAVRREPHRPSSETTNIDRAAGLALVQDMGLEK